MHINITYFLFILFEVSTLTQEDPQTTVKLSTISQVQTSESKAIVTTSARKIYLLYYIHYRNYMYLNNIYVN